MKQNNDGSIVTDFLIMVALGILFAFIGYTYAANQCKADKLEAVERTIAQANEQAEIDKEILNQSAIKSSQLNTKTITLTKTVVKHVASHPIYIGCVVPPVGMCLARAAARGESGESCTRGTDDSVPTSTRAGE